MSIHKSLLPLAIAAVLAYCRDPDKAEPEPTDSPKDDAEPADREPQGGNA